MHDGWMEIEPSPDSTEPSLRRADPLHPLDFWRGRDAKGRYVFQLDAQGSVDVIPAWPAPAGIDVRAMDTGATACQLRLVLLESANRQLFRALCSTLLEATSGLASKSASTVLPIMVEQLFRWQDMLARRKSEIMSPENVQGLVGELMFLRDELMSRVGPGAAIATWRGPYGDEQDFVLNNTVIEIKSTVSTADRRICISSEDQLDTISGPIVVSREILSVGVGAGALSLNDLVDQVQSLIPNEDLGAGDLFQRGLLAVGYERRSEYDAPAWSHVERKAYEVRDDFPRIVRSELRAGVEKVQYWITTEACLPYAIDLHSRLEGLIHGAD